jgi:hypothetical protein
MRSGVVPFGRRIRRGISDLLPAFTLGDLAQGLRLCLLSLDVSLRFGPGGSYRESKGAF